MRACVCARAYVYFKGDAQLFRATETGAASRRMAEKEGRYLAGQAKEYKTITNAFTRGIHASEQRKKRSQEGEKQRREGKREREKTRDEK